MFGECVARLWMRRKSSTTVVLASVAHQVWGKHGLAAIGTDSGYRYQIPMSETHVRRNLWYDLCSYGEFIPQLSTKCSVRGPHQRSTIHSNGLNLFQLRPEAPPSLLAEMGLTNAKQEPLVQ